MSKKRKSKINNDDPSALAESEVELPQPATETKSNLNIFAETNRGMLFDILIFLVNVFLMQMLSKRFFILCQQASDGDGIAQFVLFLFCLGLFILPPLGATLKRWHFHQRLKMQGKKAREGENLLLGCFFNPIFYFCLNIVLMATISTFIMNLLYGNAAPDGTVFVASTIFGMVFIIFQTFIVYRYFYAPKHEPQGAFLRDPRSEILGDACIFLNMIFYQLLWNLLPIYFPPRPPNASLSSEIIFRLFVLCFAALLIYFPPRIFYLAEDIRHPRIWLTILLANLPVILRMLLSA